MDDEPAVRRLVAWSLRRKGFDVIEADNVFQALTAVEERGDPIHLLLSDVDMPSIDGYELADLIKCQRPECGVLLMSARAPDDLTEPYPLMRKPFLPSVLVERVKQVIAGNGCLITD